MRLPDLDLAEPTISSVHYNDYIHHYFGRSLDELLEPIGENAVGESVRHNGVYFEIKEARRQDDASLPQGVWTHEMKIADWEQVEHTALEALCHKSKDLQLGVWLMESNIHRYGFSGIAPAAVLLRALCENFWDTMHPQMEDGDIEFRTNPINWINEKLSLRLRLLPMTSSQLDGEEYSWADWENAQRFEQMKRQNPQNIPWDGATIESFKQRLAATSKEFLLQQCHEINDALRATAELIEWFDGTCGSYSPSLHEIITLLSNVYNVAEGELKRRGVPLLASNTSDDSMSAEGNADDSANNRSNNHSNGGNGGDDGSQAPSRSGMSNRDDAFAQLREAAEFLMEDDPHSPVPYMVYTACTWGEKAAPDLYQDLFLQKGGQLNIFEMMGLSVNEK